MNGAAPWLVVAGTVDGERQLVGTFNSDDRFQLTSSADRPSWFASALPSESVSRKAAMQRLPPFAAGRPTSAGGVTGRSIPRRATAGFGGSVRAHSTRPPQAGETPTDAVEIQNSCCSAGGSDGPSATAGRRRESRVEKGRRVSSPLRLCNTFRGSTNKHQVRLAQAVTREPTWQKARTNRKAMSWRPSSA